MPKNNSAKLYHKRALLLCVLLGIIVLGSILWIVFHSNQALLPLTDKNAGNGTSHNLLYADIYQDGELKQSIPLSAVTESYAFTIYDKQNNFNQIEVRPGSIGIISADCPDKLCVHQGFIHNSLLPITCLPNRLVIQLREEQAIESSVEITPDIITY